MDNFLLPTILTLLSAAVVAALPLLQLRQTRAALQAALGSVCFAGGCLAFFAMCSGLVGGFSAASAQAADSGAREAAKEIQPKPTGDPSPATTKATADESTFFAKLPEGQLHTPPKVHADDPVIPPGRPEWVGHNVTVGSAHSIAVQSGLFATDAEADKELDRLIKQRTDEYIAEQLGSSLAPQLVGYETQKIKNELIHQQIYREQIESSVGSMQQAHALIELGPDFRERITSKWRELTAYYRLLQTGLIAGGALLFVGTVFSYFRLDNATRGYYTGRLQFMTAAAILAIVGAGVVLAKCGWIYWL